MFSVWWRAWASAWGKGRSVAKLRKISLPEYLIGGADGKVAEETATDVSDAFTDM